MKTHILHLESHDNTISVRDKMGWGKTGRIVLVWPKHGKIAAIFNQLHLTLLHRHSQDTGTNLALVTRNPDVRFHAKRLSIPLFDSVEDAQSEEWTDVSENKFSDDINQTFQNTHPADIVEMRENALQKHPDWMVHPAARLVSFTLGVLAVLAIASVLLPGANISLTPKTKSQKISMTVQASPEHDTITLSGHLPTRYQSTIVESHGVIDSSGTYYLPENHATGNVRFENLTDKAVTVPEGSIIRTSGEDPIRFETTRSSIVPAGHGKSISLPVSAVSAGPSGNLPANELVAIEGVLGLSLSAKNPHSTYGGTNTITSAPTNNDREILIEQLQVTLRETALAKFEHSLKPGDLLLTSTLTMTNVIEEAFLPQENTPSDRLNLNLRLEYQAQIVSHEELQSLALMVLDANLPDNHSPIGNNIKVTYMSRPIMTDDSSAQWQINAGRDIQFIISDQQVLDHVLGTPVDLAEKSLFENLPLSRSPQITLSPVWWPRMPYLPFRISVIQ